MAYETVPFKFYGPTFSDSAKQVQTILDSYVESHEKAVLVTVIPITVDGRTVAAIAVFANG
jgi:hypothetical protein